MLETWLDPASIAIVLVGTIIATLLRCGVADSRVAIGALRGLFETPFNAPVTGVEKIVAVFTENWARIVDVSFKVEKIADNWAHWKAGGLIEALDEPYRTDGILKAELNAAGLCTSLTLWTETLSVRESDMLSQRDA